MAEKSRPKIKAAEGFAVVSDWSGHPDVKKAIASGNVSAVEAATKKARDEGRDAFKPKNRAIPIAELKEAYEASRAQEAAQEAARQEKLESARTYGRRQQQAETAKGQRRAREKRTTEKYDATPTGGYGQPLDGFWVGGAPPMPAPAPSVPVPQVPAFPTIASGFKGPEAMPFWKNVVEEMTPRYYVDTDLFSITGGWKGSNRGPYNVGVFGQYMPADYAKYNPEYNVGYPRATWSGGVADNDSGGGYRMPFGRRFESGTPLYPTSRDGENYRPLAELPVFPYFPEVY